MSEQTSNPYFDAWVSGTEQMIQAQSDWFSRFSDSSEPADMTDVLANAKKHWQQCQQQFDSWSTAAEQWFPKQMNNVQGSGFSDGGASAKLFEKLKTMLNPETFLNSGVDELNQVFQRLAEAPDFADIGVFEKKFMRASNDWMNLQEANAQYQTVITKAWSKAFDAYIKLYPKDDSEDNSKKPDNYEEMMKQWLNIANGSLIQTQRSDEFLDAQRKVFKASTEYKRKQREIVEAWCESYSIPTRTEVDDLHRMVYELRREVRQLQTQYKKVDKELLDLKAQKVKKPVKKKVASSKRAAPTVTSTKVTSDSEDKKETVKL